MMNLLRDVQKTVFTIFMVVVMISCGGGGGGGNDVEIDTTPPPVPTGLTVTAVSASQVDLSWTGSPDAEGYKVYRDGTLYIDLFGTTTFQDINLTANTTYNYSVTAYDMEGNESARCTPASATTFDTANVLFGTAFNEFARGVAVDNSGNVYVTGWTAGSMGGFPNPGGADVFLAKLDAAGVPLWTRLLESTGVDDPDAGIDMGNFGLNIAVDSTRSFVYVTGYTTAAMDGQVFVGGRDLFLVRYDLDGNNKETRLYGTPQDDVGNAVAVDVNGNVYITGYTGDVKDILLLRFDAALAPPISQQIGSAGEDVGVGVAVNATGSAVFVTGMAEDVLPLATADSPAYAGGGDLFIARFDAVLQLEWSTLLGSSSMDAGLAIAVGGYYVKVAGMTAGTLPGKTSFGGNDILVAVYTDAGVASWVQQHGTDADEVAYGIAVDSDPGNVFISGFTSGNLSVFKPNSGLEDIFLMKFGFGGGDPFAISLAGTAMGDEGRAIAIHESDNLVYIVGHTEGNLDAKSNVGGYDMCLLEFDLTGDQQ